MLRLLLLTLLVFSIVSPAQVTVTNQGFATSSGPNFPATPSSPPVMFAPVVRLDQGQTQPFQANANNAGVVPEQPVQQTQVQNEAQPPQAQPFNFGVARFDRSFQPGSGGVGQEIDGKSLGEIAREMRQHPNGTNSRVYTNTDLDALAQGGISGTATSGTQDNWVGNNGVISPEGQLAQPSVAGPAQQQAPASGPRSPFSAPTGKPATPQPNDSQPQTASPPQAEIRPLSHRGEQVEIAQSNPQDAPPALPNAQQPDTSAQTQNAQPSDGPANPAELPATATRLPLLGVLGFFSVSMGLFVRYQRFKGK